MNYVNGKFAASAAISMAVPAITGTITVETLLDAIETPGDWRTN